MTNSDRPAKLFTIEQANAMLPLVRAITSDLASLARDVTQRRERLAAFKRRGAGSASGKKNAKSTDPYADELALMQQNLAADVQRLQEYIEELRALGLEPKGALEGLVDFPAQLDGRPVYLCWKLGETEVAHWHDLNAGIAGRQSLVAGVSTGDDAEFDGLGDSDEHS